MRAVRYHEHGGPEVLQVDDVETPEPDRGEVLVDVRAAGVNPVDTYFREGEYPVPDLPWQPGSDLAGVVRGVGDDVEAFAEGDRVFGTGLGRTEPGTYAEEVVAATDRLAALPEAVSFTEGASLALVGVTAWRAFVHHADLDPGETCFVQSGSGGVGHVAVQLADAMSARVITTASEGYHGHLRDLGADVTLDYAREDLEAAIGEAGAPDVVLETIMNEYFPLDARVAATGARIVGIGNTADEAPVPMGAGKSKDLRFQLMTMYNTPDVGAVCERLAYLAETGQVVPEIARTYPLEEAAEAQRAVLEDSFLGKLVLEVEG